MDLLNGYIVQHGLLMKLRYNISPKTQIIYVHGHNPQFLYAELEAGFPQIWTECDTSQHQYPRKFIVHDASQGPYTGEGQQIKGDTWPWEFYDAGPGTTEEFNRIRWPNKAPMPLNGEENPYEDLP